MRRVRDTDDLQRALTAILDHGLREILVTDDGGRIVGFLDETEITRLYHEATASPSPRTPGKTS